MSSMIRVFERLYSGMHYSSKKRGHNAPQFSKREFIGWLFENDFEKIYENYKENGYNKMDKPSVDRIDDYIGYEFDNMQLLTVLGNFKKPKMKIIGNKNSKFRDIKSYEKIGTTRNNFKTKCKKEGYKFEDFKEVFVGETVNRKDGNSRKKYLYFKK